MDDLAKSYIPAPPTLPAFPNAKPTKRKSQRKRWINDDGDILEWDYQHGKIERYDDRGRHKGEFDPNNKGVQTKPADPKRSITPTMWERNMTTATATRTGFQLIWFNRTCMTREDEIAVGAVDLPSVTDAEVREVFAPDTGGEYGDNFAVLECHADWLRAKTDVVVDFKKYEYFVEAVAE